MNKKYWLRGSLVGIAIAIVGLIIEYVLITQNIIQESIVLILAKPFFLLLGIITGLIEKALHLNKYALVSENIILFFALIIVSYGIIGAVIGWIYSKIRNRRQVGTTMK